MEQVKTFYNCFYRMFLFPQKFYELNNDNKPIHYDTKSNSVKNGYLYTNNGLWDTFITVYPLYSIIIPEIYKEMMEGFLNSFRHTGYLPKWLSPDERGLMPGTLIDGVNADAAVKEIASELMSEMLDAMLVAATTQSEDSNYGRQGTKDYLKSLEILKSQIFMQNNQNHCLVVTSISIYPVQLKSQMQLDIIRVRWEKM